MLHSKCSYNLYNLCLTGLHHQAVGESDCHIKVDMHVLVCTRVWEGLTVIQQVQYCNNYSQDLFGVEHIVMVTLVLEVCRDQTGTYGISQSLQNYMVQNIIRGGHEHAVGINIIC